MLVMQHHNSLCASVDDLMGLCLPQKRIFRDKKKASLVEGIGIIEGFQKPHKKKDHVLKILKRKKKKVNTVHEAFVNVGSE